MAAALTALTALAAAWSPAVEETAAGAGRLWDGREKTLVIVGYSTSYRWPNILELMINRQFQDQVLYHVRNAAAGGAPVSSWISPPGSEEWERTYGRMMRDWFLPLPHRDLPGRRRLGNTPRPTVALVQQSLQRTGPLIGGPDDTGSIRAGADALQTLVEELHRDGVELVFVTTHIYKFTHEPQVEHEKYALQELLGRGLSYVWPGPDLWTPTRDRWPEVFARNDQVHPNRRGDALLARLWLRHLERFDRGELEQSLESAWGAEWKRPVTLTEGLKQNRR